LAGLRQFASSVLCSLRESTITRPKCRWEAAVLAALHLQRFAVIKNNVHARAAGFSFLGWGNPVGCLGRGLGSGFAEGTAHTKGCRVCTGWHQDPSLLGYKRQAAFGWLGVGRFPIVVVPLTADQASLQWHKNG